MAPESGPLAGGPGLGREGVSQPNLIDVKPVPKGTAPTRYVPRASADRKDFS